MTSIAPSPSILASTANDRFTRLHSSYPPPAKEDQNLDRKGAVLEKVYVASVPTVVIWDHTSNETSKDPSPTREQGDEVWDEMEQVGGSDTEEGRGENKRHYLNPDNRNMHV